MTITRELKEEVIRLSEEEMRGRNEIARLLTGQGLRISEGSVGNIIRTRRQSINNIMQKSEVNKRLLQPHDPPSSGLNPVPINATDVNSIGSPISLGFGLKPIVTPRDGGPLSHLVDEEQPPITNSIIKDVKPNFPLMEPSPDPEANNNNVKETTTNSDDSPRADLGFPDWDSEEAWQRRFIRYVFDDKRQRSQQLQLIENGRLELEQERQRLTHWDNDLRRREAKTTELELLIPLARQLQMMNIDVNNFIPYVELVQQYSINHNMDMTTAAFDIAKNLRAFKNLEAIRNIIKQAEGRLSLLGNTIRQNEFAVTILIHLKQAGYTEKQIMDLASVIRNWNAGSHIDGKSKILDSELIDVGHQQPHPKQPNNNKNNPEQPLRESELVRLQLLRANAANMLKMMGRTG